MADESPILLPNLVRSRLDRGELVTAVSVRQARTVEIAFLLQAAGVDSFYIDMEHSTITLDAAAQIFAAALASGIPPFVRVPSAEPSFIGSCLDAGALGVIVPQLTSVDEARRAVSAAKYAPIGERSLSSSLAHTGYRRHEGRSALEELNALTMVVGMVETPEALEVLDELVATPGLDMLLIGPNDLSAALGHPGELDHPEAVRAYRGIVESGRRHHKHVGIAGMARHPELLKDLIGRGVRYVSVATDTGLIMAGAREAAQSARDLAEGSV